ncbi:MAG: hypothetical protein D5R97_05395 [Candidatus Syntrophonatronum acetioxidans]|uniref:Uncharacterized protein n=1 Tax=Candidatus Syntrophonatronum acetioxidans TaxID=1795816 RepID=A0A424YEF1_9FIRM|nr:MAG: hypothetical protein D5R97_05395 [Candidatus Syntrophonatronum acetioxidans]
MAVRYAISEYNLERVLIFDWGLVVCI